jgi:DNA-binding NarL/FixJ family response regulator
MNAGLLLAPASAGSAPPPGMANDPRRLERDGRPLSVLIVDDEPLVGMVLSDIVEEHGGRVVGPAESPKRAFALAAEHRPDVIVMDLRLKGGQDGVHAADTIKSVHGTPVVFCSGYDDPEAAARISALGSELLPKPVQPEALCAAILRAGGR